MAIWDDMPEWEYMTDAAKIAFVTESAEKSREDLTDTLRSRYSPATERSTPAYQRRPLDIDTWTSAIHLDHALASLNAAETVSEAFSLDGMRERSLRITAHSTLALAHIEVAKYKREQEKS